MPHPENHVVARQHPRHGRGTAGGLGLALFQQGVRYASEAMELMQPDPFMDVDLPLPDRRDGKVRVSYALPDDDGGERRLFVTTDRLSAFDRVIAGVPYKGQVLNQLAAWWFERTADIVPNHVLSVPDPNVLDRSHRAADARGGGRARLHHRRHLHLAVAAVRRRRPHHLRPPVPRRAAQEHGTLPYPLVTPTTKAEQGAHDEPITVAEVVEQGLVAPPCGGRWWRPRCCCSPAASRWPPRRADPRRHQVRVRPRRGWQR